MTDKKEHYKNVISELKNASDKDHHFKDGRILGSMCTEPIEIARKAHTLFLEANLGNPGLYPGTVGLEKELIAMVSKLLHGKNVSGLTVSGGTESNITALWIAKKVSGKSEVIYPKSAHFSFMKAADILGLKAKEVDLTENLQIDISEVENKLSSNTAAVVGIAGTTEFGVIDPIEELAELSGETFLHVDAAFGGFVIPFLKDLGYPMPSFDFEVANVDSITIDPHKMGLATIPSGLLLLRDAKNMEKIAVSSPYLTSPRQASLSGTRCSAGVASAYAAMKFLGMDGYKKIVGECMDTTKYIVGRIKEMGLEIAMEPIMNLVAIKMKSPEDVKKELEKLGWKPSLTRAPKCLRIVVMPHVTREIVDEFLPDLDKVCRELGEI
ncbi:MAG: tyrosine decarboxylase MfnA [Methanomassiliicoccales archaeon]|nr:MAG: tyrosine decarboxylase MfnA [Methanomassiliicoccales archaeon]